VGRVVVKRYPSYRVARAQGGNTFWTLFQHIKQNDVEMTAPVEMTLDDEMRQQDMAFLYEHGAQGRTGQQGRVDVLDLGATTVVSIGMRGNRSDAALERAKTAVQAYLQAEGLMPTGPWRVLGYNSPMVPADKRFWELQIPVAR
jgi:hypothetical protein